MNLTPWDVESKQIHTIDDTITALYCGACRWGGSEKYIIVGGGGHRTAAGFKYLNGSTSRSIGYEEEVSPTLASASLIAVLIYENSNG